MSLVKKNKKFSLIVMGGVSSLLLFFFLSLAFADVERETARKVSSEAEVAVTKDSPLKEKLNSITEGKKSSGSKAQVPGGNFQEKDFGPKVDDESRGWLMFQVLLILSLLAGGFYLFYKFVSQKAGFRSSGEGVMETLSAISLGPGRYVYIIDVVGRVLVLGVTDNSVTLLSEIEDRDEKDRIRLLSSRSEATQGKGFGEFLSESVSRLVDRMGELKSRDGKQERGGGFSDLLEQESDDVTFLRSQKNRLKKMNGDDKE